MMNSDEIKELKVLREMHGNMDSLLGFKIMNVKEREVYTFLSV